MSEQQPEGAIDSTFDEAERDPKEILAERNAEYARAIGVDDVCIDLVTRQPLYVLDVAAPSVATYFDEEDFDLLNYNQAPYLPVRMDDRVLNCVFVPRSVEGVHKMGKTYAYPEGRLARVPIERAGGDSG